MDNHTERLAEGAWRIEVGPSVNAFVLANDGRSDREGLTLVDTGFARSGPRLVRSIRLAGLNPAAIRDVLLTHWHRDHTGSAARFTRSSAAPRICAGAGDVAVITGEVANPHRIAPPGDVTRVGRRAGLLSRPGEPVGEVTPLQGGERLDIAGGLVVVATPGHTAGHLSFHLPREGLVLAGDAVLNIFWLSSGIPAMQSARRSQGGSLRRLAGLNAALLAPSHGPPVRRRIAERLLRLAEKADRAAGQDAVDIPASSSLTT